MDPRQSTSKSKLTKKNLQGRFTASNSQPTNRQQIQPQHHQFSTSQQPQFSPYPHQYPPQYSNYPPQYSQYPTQFSPPFPSQFSTPDSPQLEPFSQFASQNNYSNMLSQIESQKSYDEQLGYHQSVDRGNDDDDDEDAEVEIIPAFVAPTTKKARGKGKEPMVKMEGDKKAWELWEDQVLANCWCRYSETTYEHTSNKFWGKITEIYNSEMQGKSGYPRNLKALQNRWGKIRKDSLKWLKVITKARAAATSGASESSVQRTAESMYQTENGYKFKFSHTFSILQNCEKFNTTTTSSSSLAFQLDQANLNMTSPSQGCGSSGGSSKRSYEQFSESQSEEVQSPMKPTGSDFSVGHERPFGVKKMADLENPGRKALRDSKKKKKLQFADIPEDSAVSAAREYELELERLRYRTISKAATIKKKELAARKQHNALQLLKMMQTAANTPEKEAAYFAQLEKYTKRFMVEEEEEEEEEEEGNEDDED